MFQKGHTLSRGNKGGGRKTKLAEIKVALADAKEKVTQEALIELANSKVFQLLQTCATIEEVKALGLPITLKGITEKIDHTTLGEKITNSPDIKELTLKLNEIYGGTSQSSDGELTSLVGDKTQDKE